VASDAFSFITGSKDNDLFHGVVGVAWGDGFATLTGTASYNCSDQELLLSNVAQLMSLVPEGKRLELHTESEWLATEMGKMKGHEEADFSGDMS
jgi:hypothetical protein